MLRGQGDAPSTPKVTCRIPPNPSGGTGDAGFGECVRIGTSGTLCARVCEYARRLVYNPHTPPISAGNVWGTRGNCVMPPPHQVMRMTLHSGGGHHGAHRGTTGAADVAWSGCGPPWYSRSLRHPWTIGGPSMDRPSKPKAGLIAGGRPSQPRPAKSAGLHPLNTLSGFASRSKRIPKSRRPDDFSGIRFRPPTAQDAPGTTIAHPGVIYTARESRHGHPRGLPGLFRPRHARKTRKSIIPPSFCSLSTSSTAAFWPTKVRIRFAPTAPPFKRLFVNRFPC